MHEDTMQFSRACVFSQNAFYEDINLPYLMTGCSTSNLFYYMSFHYQQSFKTHGNVFKTGLCPTFCKIIFLPFVLHCEQLIHESLELNTYRRIRRKNYFRTLVQDTSYAFHYQTFANFAKTKKAKGKKKCKLYNIKERLLEKQNIKGTPIGVTFGGFIDK